MSEEHSGVSDRTLSTVIFRGRSGVQFRFHTWPFGTKFKPVGAVYIVTRRSFEDPTFTTKATHQPLVIGQTANLADPLVSASQRAQLVAKGANCICVYAVADVARRAEIEKDLIDGNEHCGGRLQYLSYLTRPATEPAEVSPGRTDVAS